MTQKYLTESSKTHHSDYSLWRATRNLNRPKVRTSCLRTTGNWAKSDSDNTPIRLYIYLLFYALVAQIIIVIHQPGKPAKEITSYSQQVCCL